MSQQFIIWCKSDPSKHERLEAYDPDDAAKRYADHIYHGSSLARQFLMQRHELSLAMKDSFGKHHDRTVRMSLVPEFAVVEE